MKVLIIHNILWAHYKSALFEALEQNAPKDCDFLVIQIAKNELSRREMENGNFDYDYRYQLLFDDYIENISLTQKIGALFKAIWRYKPDIINVTGYAVDPALTLCIFFGKLLGKKIVISTESTTLDAKKNPVKEWLKSLIIKMADGFICFGTTSTQYMLELGAKKSQIIEQLAAVVDDKKIVKIYKQSLELGFKIPKVSTPKNFIFVGRLIAAKNIDLLLKSFSKFKNQTPSAYKWGLLILGEGNQKEELEKMTRDLKTPDIHFIAGQPWYEVPKYLTLANILVLPSQSEPWGLVVNEAMLCGKPIIVSDACGSALDLVKGNGLIFESGNEQALLSCMMKIAENEILEKAMGEESMQIIKKFSTEAVSLRIIDQLKKQFQK
jgi:glycosyltransferase involved in cell wall biosynthesis